MERVSGGMKLLFLINIWKKHPKLVVLFLKPDILGFKEKLLRKKLMWLLKVLVVPLIHRRHCQRPPPVHRAQRPQVLQWKGTEAARIFGLGH